MFLKIFLPLFIVVAVVAGGYYVITTNEGEVVEDSTLSEIEDVIKSQIFEGSGIPLSSLKVTHASPGHARASFTNSKTTEGDVFLLKVDSEWQVIEMTEDDFFCEQMEKYGFPANFITDCVLEYPEVITAEEFLENIQEIIDNDEEVTLLGTFEPDPDGDGEGVIVIPGDEVDDIEIPYDPDEDDDLGDGDQVIVDVTVEEDGEDEDDDPDIIVEDVEEINEDDDDPEEEDVQDNGDDTENNNDEGGEDTDPGDETGDTNDGDGGNEDTGGEDTGGEDDDFDLTDYPPETDPGDDFYINLLDIDNSYIEVEIIGD